MLLLLEAGHLSSLISREVRWVIIAEAYRSNAFRKCFYFDFEFSSAGSSSLRALLTQSFICASVCLVFSTCAFMLISTQIAAHTGDGSSVRCQSL